MRYCDYNSSVISPGWDLNNKDNGTGKPKPPHNTVGSPITLQPQPLEGYIQMKSWDEGCGPLARWWRGRWRSIDNCSDSRMNQGQTTTTVHVVLVPLLSCVTLRRWLSLVPRWNGWPLWTEVPKSSDSAFSSDRNNVITRYADKLLFCGTVLRSLCKSSWTSMSDVVADGTRSPPFNIVEVSKINNSNNNNIQFLFTSWKPCKIHS